MSMPFILYFAVNTAIFITLATLVFFALQYPWIYKTFREPRYDRKYIPSVALFLPCKGAPKDFAGNIKSVLAIKYNPIRLFFLVEDEHDAAYAVLRKAIRGHKNARLIKTGRAVSCGQKNFNLVKGVKAAGKKEELFVFMDSDIEVSARWIKDLVLPLSDKKVMLTTGCMWLSLHTRSFGERVHSYMVALQHSLMYFMPVSAVWGGCMAIRRVDYERLNMMKIWLGNVSDDMGMQSTLMLNRAKVVMVPTCEGHGRDPFPRLGPTLDWITRQGLMVKNYLRPLWVFALVLLGYLSAQFILFPAAVVYTVQHPTMVTIPVTAMLGSTILTIMAASTLIRWRIKDNHSRLTWFVFSPAYFLLTAFALFRTLFTNVVHWSGITYYLSFFGSVKRIERKD
ncbi:MAG: glycosyltransferase family 2 protein [Spirochaetota bacterium]